MTANGQERLLRSVQSSTESWDYTTEGVRVGDIRGERWLRRYRRRQGARVNLVCFPHAGGSAPFYRPWAEEMPGVVEVTAVQYAGRADRSHESWPESIDSLADQVTGALTAMDDRPLALFGHSLGAAVAFEVARRWEGAKHLPALTHLFVSGRTEPAKPGRRHLDSDDALWEYTSSLGGTSDELLTSADLRTIALPVLRHDVQLSETYRPVPGPPLACPISVYYGRQDDEVATSRVRTWSSYTSGETTTMSFSGDHFYLVEQRGEVMAAILRAIDASSARRSPWPSTP